MSVLLSKDFLDSVEDLAVSMLKDLEDSAVEAMVNAKGLAYGDVEPSLNDRIMKFVIDDQEGVNAALQFSEPDEYRRRLKQFQRDVQEAGMV